MKKDIVKDDIVKELNFAEKIIVKVFTKTFNKVYNIARIDIVNKMLK